MSKKTIEVSEELFEAIQQLKWILKQITWQEIKTEEEIVWILVSWFIESLEDEEGWEEDTIEESKK